MLTYITPVQFKRLADGGLTQAACVLCRDEAGNEFEVIAKLSGNCTRGVASLAIEALSAMLARDLGLPVPQPFVLALHSEWQENADEHDWFALASRSSKAAFASRKLKAGYRTWLVGSRLPRRACQTAAQILVFDALVENTDRREDNPNCLVKGDEICIIDHELAFSGERMGPNWRPPWKAGGLRSLRAPGEHIFRHLLDPRKVDWAIIEKGWKDVPDSRLRAYANAIPVEWQYATPVVKNAIATVRAVRDHIGECLIEIQRVLRQRVDAGPLGPLLSEDQRQPEFNITSKGGGAGTGSPTW